MHAIIKICTKTLWQNEKSGVKLPKCGCQQHEHYFFILVMVSVNYFKHVLITTFLFVKTQLCNNYIPNEGCEYLHVFEFNRVQESLTHLCDLLWCILMYGESNPYKLFLMFTTLKNVQGDAIYQFAC